MTEFESHSLYNVMLGTSGWLGSVERKFSLAFNNCTLQLVKPRMFFGKVEETRTFVGKWGKSYRLDSLWCWWKDFRQHIGASSSVASVCVCVLTQKVLNPFLQKLAGWLVFAKRRVLYFLKINLLLSLLIEKEKPDFFVQEIIFFLNQGFLSVHQS